MSMRFIMLPNEYKYTAPHGVATSVQMENLYKDLAEALGYPVIIIKGILSNTAFDVLLNDEVKLALDEGMEKIPPQEIADVNQVYVHIRYFLASVLGGALLGFLHNLGNPKEIEVLPDQTELAKRLTAQMGMWID